MASATQHLLVIDDEPFVGQIIRLLFEKGPFKVSTAQDGAAGLAFLEQHGGVGCVLVDINMPGLSGLDVIERARANPALRDQTFVVLTAAGDQLLPARAELLGVRAFITKPFSPSKLYRQVCDLLGVDAGPQAEGPGN